MRGADERSAFDGLNPASLREKRAKIIHAADELEASDTMAQAAAVIAAQPLSITLRYLPTLTEIAAEKKSTIIFPLPIELLELLKAKLETSPQAKSDR